MRSTEVQNRQAMRRHHQRPALTEPLVQMLDKLLLADLIQPGRWVHPAAEYSAR